MPVRDWIAGFLDRHRTRFDPHDWPTSDGSEEMRVYVQTWVTAFNLKEVGEKEADEASRRLSLSPPNFRREHIPMVVQAIDQLRAERGPVAIGGTREAAKYASRDCEHCGSEGLATAYHPWPSDEHRVAATAAATCICPHGRWIRKNWSESDPDMLRRIPDFDHVLNGGSAYLAEHPGVAGLVNESEEPAARVPAMRVPAKSESISAALQFIVGMLAVRPTPLSKMLAGAREFRISHGAMFEAADKLEVIKTTVDGEEIWDLEQGRNR
jgi:hypothetical protein